MYRAYFLCNSDLSAAAEAVGHFDEQKREAGRLGVHAGHVNRHLLGSAHRVVRECLCCLEGNQAVDTQPGFQLICIDYSKDNEVKRHQMAMR